MFKVDIFKTYNMILVFKLIENKTKIIPFYAYKLLKTKTSNMIVYVSYIANIKKASNPLI